MLTQLFHAVQRTARSKPANLQLVEAVVQLYVLRAAVRVRHATQNRLYTRTHAQMDTSHTQR